VRPAFVPSREHECLLRAALWRGEDACTRGASAIAGGYGPPRRGIRASAAAGLSKPPEPRRLARSRHRALKPRYLRTWYANQLSFDAMAHVIDAFDRAAIRTMLLKGAALTMLTTATTASAHGGL